MDVPQAQYQVTQSIRSLMNTCKQPPRLSVYQNTVHQSQQRVADGIDTLQPQVVCLSTPIYRHLDGSPKASHDDAIAKIAESYPVPNAVYYFYADAELASGITEIGEGLGWRSMAWAAGSGA